MEGIHFFTANSREEKSAPLISSFFSPSYLYLIEFVTYIEDSKSRLAG